MEEGSTIAIAPCEKNSLVESLQDCIDLDSDEIHTFFYDLTSPRSLARQASRVKGFCGDAPPILDDTKRNDVNGWQSYRGEKPIAWVSEPDWSPDITKAPVADGESAGRVLGNKELWITLQRYRVSGGDRDLKAGPPRRIYVNKPDAYSVWAIIKTTPPSQVPGFRELLANYVTEAPKPVMSSREIFWWGAVSFVFSFNLPFYAISAQNQLDTRTLFDGKRPLRSRLDLSFLRLGKSEEHHYTETESSETQLCLVEGVSSVVVTGRSSHYWTAICFNDDLYDDVDEPRVSPEDDVQHMDGETDPIILKMNDKPESPRAYALAALATALVKIADFHKDIHYVFETSLNSHFFNSVYSPPESRSPQNVRDWIRGYPQALREVIHHNKRIVGKLEHFLSHHLLINPEGLPQHRMWLNVQNEERAMQSLTDIKDSLDVLCDINHELTCLLKSYTEARQEEKRRDQDELAAREGSLQKLMFATFVLGILNLTTQAYAGVRENGNTISSPVYGVLLWTSLTVCLLVYLGLSWSNLRPYLPDFTNDPFPLSYIISQKQRRGPSHLINLVEKISIMVEDHVRPRQLAESIRRKAKIAIRRAARNILPA